MYLLDTNVLSEFMRPNPSAKVVDWLDAQSLSTLYLASISQAEILLGLGLLDDGKRKTLLTLKALDMFGKDFMGRCLDFDNRAAKHYADVIVQRRKQGLPTSVEDAQIAAIALTHQLTLVTRNTKDFESILGLHLINPWK
ncbi:MAG: type II toxin-antitoxin system VapC family toxin [Thiomicrospira sp.]|uniref:type II toxin-antitoxin system VapC family toxin n=1 Tax=Thiomicrospira sp. TaxID=935 RepID=UPI001A0AE699|nr:type II toxin-antitoxin system VapC family toxin [Thiomicrospira sp.]MBE0493595.1 type II toxin-antitoxin system VapC family toxin [Thiomicrospira sp.]